MVLHPKVGWFSKIGCLRVIESLFPSCDSKGLVIHVYSSKNLIIAEKKITGYNRINYVEISMKRLPIFQLNEGQKINNGGSEVVGQISWRIQI